ncbi:ParA family protein, partial [Klebsiella pneumoniae]|uniref:ParA family protein n=1 Tax=Klebsiella pneumoniae TaxID=573 RepID=UPI003EE002CA
IRASCIPNLDLIPSTVDLSGAELELIKMPNRDSVLKNKLESIRDKYDYIFVDCPPSLSMLTVNALVFAKAVLIPLQCEFFALEGLSHLLRTINLVQKRLNPNLRIEGIVLTM